METLSLARWDGLLQVARGMGLLSRVAEDADRLVLFDSLPDAVRPHLQAALAVGRRHRKVIEWEIECLDERLSTLEGPVVLLKGAAYCAAGLPIAVGRLSSDIDLLVQRDQLAQAEQLLLAAGWKAAELDPNDERYFRTWMHEIPPLVHQRRRTLVDLHHSILPLTDRLKLRPQLLLDAARPLPGTRHLHVLAPADMVLHSAAHLFRNGDFSTALRDLADLDGLMRHFGSEPAFWSTLVTRAEQLDLRLPCYCGLRYSRRLFETPIPSEVLERVAPWQPRLPGVAMIDRLVEQAIYPRFIDRPDSQRLRAIALLAHWPVPRLRTMLTSLFWVKRLAKLKRRWKNFQAGTPAK